MQYIILIFTFIIQVVKLQQRLINKLNFWLLMSFINFRRTYKIPELTFIW